MKQLLGVLFFTGILIAGSEGPWWPWANLCGLALTALAGWRVQRYAA